MFRHRRYPKAAITKRTIHSRTTLANYRPNCGIENRNRPYSLLKSEVTSTRLDFLQ